MSERMRMEPTEVQYQWADESGYRFRVVCTRDARGGWDASVIMSAHGFLSPEAAVEHVLLSAKEFIRQVEDTP